MKSGLFKQMDISMETLAAQDQVLFKDLVLQFETMRDMSQSERAKALVEVERIIKKHTGLTVNTTLSEDDFFMMPPVLNIDHPLFKSKGRTEVYNENKEAWYKLQTEALQQCVKDQGGKIYGTVDLNKARVTGPLADLVFELGVWKDAWDYPVIKSEHIAAMTIHEVGHCFYFLAALDRQTTTNEIMLNASLALLASEEDTNKKAFVIDTVKEYIGTTEDTTDLAKASVPTIVASIQRGMMANLERRATIAGDYYQVSYEALADQFCSRMGAGYYNAEFLDMFSRIVSPDSLQRKSTKLAVTTEVLAYTALSMQVALRVLAVGALVMMPVTLTVKALLVGFVGTIGALGVYRSHGEIKGYINSASSHNGLYDNTAVRLTRIKEDLVNQLKDKKTPKRFKERLLSDIEKMDLILKDYQEYKPLLDRVSKCLPWKTSRKQLLSDYETQRQLEQLMANDLFVQAMLLKTK